MERKKSAYLKFAIGFLIIIYMVGIAGLHNDSTRDLFQKIVPFNILLSTAILLFFHYRWSRVVVTAMLIIFLSGFLIELIGVNTGKIFGAYHYGTSLGWKIIHTPVIIGLNWLMLIYITCVTVKHIIIKSPWMELTGAALMTVMDYLIEPVATKYDFWQWENGIIPIQNFAAWFIISFVMLYYFNRVKAVEKNEIAIPLLAIQFLFFFVLNIL